MTYEAVIPGFFPFFLIATVIQLFYRSEIWNILHFLLTVQLVGLIKSSSASCLRGNIIMVFMSLYSMLYMSSLLPAKMFAVATINKAGWGTSGRKSIDNFIGLIPVSVWYTILLGGVIFTIYKESKKPFSESKQGSFNCWNIALCKLLGHVFDTVCDSPPKLWQAEEGTTV